MYVYICIYRGSSVTVFGENFGIDGSQVLSSSSLLLSSLELFDTQVFGP